MELVYDNYVVTSRLLQLVKSSIHDKLLKDNIIQRAIRNPADFDRVDWDAYSAAFHQCNRLHQLSITKLVHGLYHTQHEANKIYGSSPMCPCCNHGMETLSHDFTCPADLPATNWHTAIDSLTTTLENLHTPLKLMQVLMDSVPMNIHNKTLNMSSYHYSGVPSYPMNLSLFSHFRSNLPWGVRDASLWIKKVIVAMWAYSSLLWKFRNSIVHGASKEDEKEKRLEQLHQHVRHEYSLYESDQFLVSPSLPPCSQRSPLTIDFAWTLTLSHVGYGQ